MRPSSHSGSPTSGTDGRFRTKTYDFTTDVRNSKVVYTLKRAYGVAHYFLGAAVLEEQTRLNVVVDEQTQVDCVENHDFVLELYKTDALVRQTDDLIDRELYPQNPTPTDRIQAVIDEFRTADRTLPTVAELWETELELTTGDNSRAEYRTLLERAARHSCADFTALAWRIVEEQGSHLSDDDLAHARDYCESFLACRDLVDDAFSLEDDIGTDEFNPFTTVKREGIDREFVDRLFTDCFESMKTAQSAIDDPELTEYFRENTTYWVQKYESVVDSIVQSYLDEESYRDVVFRSR